MDLKKFCTHCFSWGNWDQVCHHCRYDFSHSRICKSCGFLSDGVLCRSCSYTHPMNFPSWYPSNFKECMEQVKIYEEGYLPQTRIKRAMGGVLPHAGWFYSGSISAKTIRSLKILINPECVVVFGAVHRVNIEKPCILLGGEWETPLGSIKIDMRMNAQILKHFPQFLISEKIQRTEHSIEIEAPLIRYFFPQATLVSIMIPPLTCSIELGMACARAAQEDGRRVLFLASTDLSHYGSSFQYEPYGALPKALEAVHQVDHQILDLMMEMREDEIIPQAEEFRNSCGPGAVAAAVHACKVLGAQKGELLEYTTSMEVRPRQSSDSTVGYASLIWGV